MLLCHQSKLILLQLWRCYYLMMSSFKWDVKEKLSYFTTLPKTPCSAMIIHYFVIRTFIFMHIFLCLIMYIWLYTSSHLYFWLSFCCISFSVLNLLHSNYTSLSIYMICHILYLLYFIYIYIYKFYKFSVYVWPLYWTSLWGIFILQWIFNINLLIKAEEGTSYFWNISKKWCWMHSQLIEILSTMKLS